MPFRDAWLHAEFISLSRLGNGAITNGRVKSWRCCKACRLSTGNTYIDESCSSFFATKATAHTFCSSDDLVHRHSQHTVQDHLALGWRLHTLCQQCCRPCTARHKPVTMHRFCSDASIRTPKRIGNRPLAHEMSKWKLEYASFSILNVQIQQSLTLLAEQCGAPPGILARAGDIGGRLVVSRICQRSGS